MFIQTNIKGKYSNIIFHYLLNIKYFSEKYNKIRKKNYIIE